MKREEDLGLRNRKSNAGEGRIPRMVRKRCTWMTCNKKSKQPDAGGSCL
jgi:hypothetical protein